MKKNPRVVGSGIFHFYAVRLSCAAHYIFLRGRRLRCRGALCGLDILLAQTRDEFFEFGEFCLVFGELFFCAVDDVLRGFRCERLV